MTATVTGRRRDVIRRLVVTLIVLAGIGALVWAFQRTDTGEPDVVVTGDPSIVELLQPAEGSEVLRQAQLGIDLAFGWTGVLIVNGVEIPEDQLTRRAELNQIFFTPGEGQVIEQLLPGENCVRAVVWRVEMSRESARNPIDWCFQAT